MVALAAGLRQADRGSRGRERERVRGSLAAGGIWSGHRAPPTGGAHAARRTLSAHATAYPTGASGRTTHPAPPSRFALARRAHARQPFGLLGILCVWAAFAPTLAHAQDDDTSQAPRLRAPSLSMEPEAKPEALVKVPSLKVVRVQFRGNRKVEDDAIRVNLHTLPGQSLNKDILQDDVRVIWKMGYFEDVQVETTDTAGGVLLTYVLKEKPAIRKIYVSGHEEVGLSKINEVLDIKKEQVLDLAKIKKNVEKIRELYLQRGFYMADVDYELRRDSPGEVDVYFRVHENSKVEVRRVNFTGNQHVTDQELRDVMLTQSGDLFSAVSSSGTYREDVFQRDLTLIQGYYFDRGYINVKVAEPRLELSADKRSLYISISIDEGEQYRIGSIEIKGDLLENPDVLLGRLQVKPGEIFNRSKVAQDVQAIADFYKNKGYAYVNSTPETTVNEKQRTVSLFFDIQKGSEVTFERINIHGNSKTRDKVIRRELRVYEGERYSQSGLDLSKRRVNALGFFEKVETSTKRGSGDDAMEVNVEVAERQTGAFQIGAGFSSVESFIAQAQISQNNLLGRGQSLVLQAQMSSLRQLFMLQFDEPYFLDSNWHFGFNLFDQQRYYLGFTRQSKGGSLTWGYLLTDSLRMFLTYTLQDISVTTGGRSNLFSGGQRSPLPQGSLANLLHAGMVSSVRISLTHDTRNDRMFPRSGWYNSISAEFAEPDFLSESQFSRFEGTARYFYPLWGPLVLRLKGDIGAVVSREPQGVPIFERYFVGGIYDVRGFQIASLGPQIRVPSAQSPDSNLRTFAVGGNMQVVGKIELEMPLFEKLNIRAVVFSDVGNAYNLERQYCRLKPASADLSVDPCVAVFPLNSLRSSWGFGLRWFSPIGPLRFEWGFPYKPLPGEDSSVFEFTIGNDL
jgi:outer membrane protein insertion porin family